MVVDATEAMEHTRKDTRGGKPLARALPAMMS